MKPERGNMYINEGENMDSTHTQGLRKGCCALNIDLERKKKGKKNSRFVLLDLETTKEYIKTIYFANHFWKLSKKQAGVGGENEQPLLCFSSLPSLTRRIKQCEKLGSFENGKLKAGFAFQ